MLWLLSLCFVQPVQLQGFWGDFHFWFVFTINAASSGWRARGRPKTTLRRTIEKERNKARWKSWGVAKAVAQDEEKVLVKKGGGLMCSLAR